MLFVFILPSTDSRYNQHGPCRVFDCLFGATVLVLSVHFIGMKFLGLRLAEYLLIVVILMQSLAIIIVYEGALQPKLTTSLIISNEVSASNDTNTDYINNPESSGDSANVEKHLGVHHTTPNPGGLILSSSFSYRQDPREVNRKNPLPHILPTFENIYYFDTTVNHYGLHAIIFHDGISFNETFVKTHTSEYIKFVRVEAPTFDDGEPIISPNDFRYVVFDKWLKDNSILDPNGQMIVNGINYGWYLISDLDMMFQRNPFPKLDDYANRLNLTFFGSFDGGKWEDESMRLQRKLFRNWYVASYHFLYRACRSMHTHHWIIYLL